jgi:hypothetical protein
VGYQGFAFAPPALRLAHRSLRSLVPLRKDFSLEVLVAGVGAFRWISLRLRNALPDAH